MNGEAETADDFSYESTGSLYTLNDDESTLTRVFGEVGVSNGIAWSEDGSTMFFIDTKLRTIDALDYDLSTGEACKKKNENAWLALEMNLKKYLRSKPENAHKLLH